MDGLMDGWGKNRIWFNSRIQPLPPSKTITYLQSIKSINEIWKIKFW